MVTNKKSAAGRVSSIVIALVALCLGGCQPAGPKSLLLGEKYIQQGDYEKALKYLTRATVLIPEHPQVWNHLGLAYHGLRQPVKAVEAYQRAIRIDRHLPEPHYNLGVLLLEQQHLPQAVVELSTFVNLKTNSAAGWVKLGTAYVRLKRPDEAERALIQALRLDPKNAEAHNALGLAHVQRKRPREAVQSFNNALQFDSDYGPAVLNQAIVSDQYFANKQLALERYRAFLSTKPEGTTAAHVQKAIQRLEAELAPRVAEGPPQTPTNVVTSPSAATNLVMRTPPTAATNVIAQANTNDAATVAQTKIDTNAPALPPTNKVVAALTSTNPPATLEKKLEEETEPEPPLTVEVLRVNKEPEFKPPADLPALTVTNRLAVNTTPATDDIPETKPLIVSRRDRKDDDKEGILSRMNPGRWFRDNKKEDQTIARAPAAPAPRPSYPPVVRNADPTPEPPRLIPRYQYRKKVPLKAGNRAEAEKHFRQGAAAHEQRRYGEAIEFYRNATNLDPTYFEAYYNLGIAAYQNKNLPLALSANELAVTAKPASTEARYNFAIALREANYPADAANELRTLVVEQPDAERAHLALANLYAQQLDEPILARRHYLAVLEVNPNHPEAPLIRQWLGSHP